MFTDKLLNWYSENGRDLPWRRTDNPYYIWLSEIILQQTRIEQGRAYYERFIKEYPTVRHLADATEEQVLKTWQGLGYYSRARNLHAAARHIAHDLGGRFPDTYEGILALKGVGRYTAAAIASFAFRLPHPVIDGNVYRFVSRLYGIYTPIGTDTAYREFETLLTHLIDRDRPDLFNQALMDFGSTWCKPTGCDCGNCIFAQECVARREGKVALLPVKPDKVQVKPRYFYYIDIQWLDEGDTVALVHRREAGDIWQGLYELPLCETSNALADEETLPYLRQQLVQWFGTEPNEILAGPCFRHQLTHRLITAQFLQARYSQRPSAIPEKFTVVRRDGMKKLPVPRLIDKYLKSL